MKIIQINLRKTLLLVELPDGSGRCRMWPYDDKQFYFDDPMGYDGINGHKLDFDVELIGHFPSIPESYWEGVVEKWEEGQYQDYVLFRGHLQNCVETPKESIISAIKAEGWLLENSYGAYDENIIHGDASDFFKEWQEAQSKVIDLNNVWIFEQKEVTNE